MYNYLLLCRYCRSSHRHVDRPTGAYGAVAKLAKLGQVSPTDFSEVAFVLTLFLRVATFPAAQTIVDIEQEACASTNTHELRGASVRMPLLWPPSLVRRSSVSSVVDIDFPG